MGKRDTYSYSDSTSAREVAEDSGLSLSTIRKHLSKLTAQGRIKREGQASTGYVYSIA